MEPAGKNSYRLVCAGLDFALHPLNLTAPLYDGYLYTDRDPRRNGIYGVKCIKKASLEWFIIPDNTPDKSDHFDEFNLWSHDKRSYTVPHS
ncbi:MAG: hypothetical protein GWN00_08705 [Aliifodinibius sp.]|nr:hypothetical protein [Fodinibius sp.]NIV11263.1 hypothetical protein [Fodinibius sp.]NIY24882.1 hypothetical protein [Fodinibius sp.]